MAVSIAIAVSIAVAVAICVAAIVSAGSQGLKRVAARNEATVPLHDHSIELGRRYSKIDRQPLGPAEVPPADAPPAAAAPPEGVHVAVDRGTRIGALMSAGGGSRTIERDVPRPGGDAGDGDVVDLGCDVGTAAIRDLERHDVSPRRRVSVRRAADRRGEVVAESDSGRSGGPSEPGRRVRRWHPPMDGYEDAG